MDDNTRFTIAFKKEVAIEGIKEKLTLQEMIETYGVSEKLILEWIEEFLNGQYNEELNMPKEEQHESKKKLDELNEELDKLKKEKELLQKKLLF